MWSLSLGFDLILPSDNINTFTLSSEHFSLGLDHCSPIWTTIQHTYLLCRPTSLHVPQTTIFNFCYFIIIAKLFDYSPVNFNKNHAIFKLWGYLDILQLYLYYCAHHPDDGYMCGGNTLVTSVQ